MATTEKAPILRRLAEGRLFSGGLLVWRGRWTKAVHQNVDRPRSGALNIGQAAFRLRETGLLPMRRQGGGDPRRRQRNVAGQEFWPPFADCQLETERQIPVVLDPIHRPSGPERAPQFMDFTPMFLGELRAFP